MDSINQINISNVVKNLWRKSEGYNSLKVWARATLRNPEADSQDKTLVSTWLRHKMAPKKVVKMKFKKIRKGKGTWEAQVRR